MAANRNDTPDQPLDAHKPHYTELQIRLAEVYGDMHRLVCCGHLYRDIIYTALATPEPFHKDPKWLTGLGAMNRWLYRDGEEAIARMEETLDWVDQNTRE